ncbi:MAG: hypothetical protein QOH25_1605 [Acidobacteriota bacterium]|jgi:hypothetical protein|nr:hypothetical protein [Acidobacteriota bacterium]
MKGSVPTKRQAPFQFVLDELFPIRPTIKQMFGFTYIYLDEKLLVSLRESAKQPQYNGVWLYTQAEHIESLRREFPQLPRRCFWKSLKSGSGWVILASTLEDFEECAFRACELILRGDQRIGRVTRRGGTKPRGVALNR